MKEKIMDTPEKKYVLKTLISEFDLKLRLDTLAKEIAVEFSGQEIVLIGLLKGSFILLADLARLLHMQGIPLQIDFITASSYCGGTESIGEVKITKDAGDDISGKSVLLIDDILDTGRTLDTVVKKLNEKSPKVVKTCVLLDKPERRVVPFEADFVGFEIENEFVVGYGLDFDNRYREYPSISKVEFVT